MQLMCFDDRESQALYLNPFHSAWTSICGGDEESQPLWLTVNIRPAIRDACSRLEIGELPAWTLLLDEEFEGGLRLVPPAQWDLEWPREGDQCLRIAGDCSLILDAETLAGAAVVLGLPEEGGAELRVDAEGDARLMLRGPGEARIRVDRNAVLVLRIEAGASLALHGELCDE